MSANDSYQRQLNLLTQLQNQLHSLGVSIDAIRSKYQQQIRTANDAGFMSDYTNNLENRFVRFSALSDGLLEHIEASRIEINFQEEVLHDLATRANDDQ